MFRLIVCLVIVASVHAGDWPGWRGPTGDGISLDKNLPVEWGSNKNVKWKVALPAPGNSTPIVQGNKVFVTQAVGEERMLMCFDRRNGKLLWKKGVSHEKTDPSHKTNPHASGSPVTDGDRVIVSYASAGVHCYDLKGNKLWSRDLGEQAHIWGYGASPMIHGELVYLNFGPGERSFLMAMDKRTGKTVWQVDDQGGGFGNKVPGKSGREIWIGSWSTPIVRTVNGREELILTWPKRVVAFDPKNGEQLWQCKGLNQLVYTSPIYADGIVVAMGGYSGSALAVKAGGKGDVTETHRLWQKPKTPQRIGSAVIYKGHYYILNDRGIAQCFELKTGKEIWAERMRGEGKTSQNWSSLVLSGDKLYAANQGGDAFVFRASPKFELLATNSMREKTIGSMAVSNGEIFIRTHKNLWCIAK
tara:strand:+ start:20362 stop:21609 length:1248 start_codon:yes stop_codon:yes gene_type:complete